MDALRFMYNHFREYGRVTFGGAYPEGTSLRLGLFLLRLLGVWPQESRIHSIVNAVYIAALFSFILTITCDLYDASSNFIAFGDDLCILVALCMILFKLILFRMQRSEIEWISSEFERMYRKSSMCSHAVKEIQRADFIQEVSIVYIYQILGYVLYIAIVFQPLLSDQPGMLPFRAKFPFSLEDNRNFVAAYVFQCVCTLINVKLILFIDMIGVVFITQTSSNLKVLCQRIREMSNSKMSRSELGEIVKDHQTIIRLTDYVNECFYFNYMAQVSASTFLICLTAFEAQLAKDQPLVALKFQTFMFSSFMQLFYWCWTGSRVQVDSLEVAEVAYQCEWVSQSNEFRRDLSIVIQRGQKPLSMRAQPFYGFDFQSFANILSTSYSYFTLLRTLND